MLCNFLIIIIIIINFMCSDSSRTVLIQFADSVRIQSQSPSSPRTKFGLGFSRLDGSSAQKNPNFVRIQSQDCPRTAQTLLGLHTEYVGECKDLKRCHIESSISSSSHLLKLSRSVWSFPESETGAESGTSMFLIWIKQLLLPICFIPSSSSFLPWRISSGKSELE